MTKKMKRHFISASVRFYYHSSLCALTFFMKPRPKSVDPAILHELAHNVIRKAKFPMLATVDESAQPRLRPVSPVRVDDDFTVWVANLAGYQKTGQIKANPKVELAYLEPDHDQIRITGIAHIETHPQTIEAIWSSNPLLKQYLGSPENPEFVLYRIEPDQVRFMREWALDYHNVPRQPT